MRLCLQKKNGELLWSFHVSQTQLPFLTLVLCSCYRQWTERSYNLGKLQKWLSSWVRTALEENLNVVPSTHVACLTTAYDSVPGDPMSFSWLLGHLYWPHHAHIHTTKKKIILFIKEITFWVGCLFLFHYLCVRPGWTTTPHRWGSEDSWWELGLFPRSLVLGIKLTSTGLAASVFTYLAI